MNLSNRRGLIFVAIGLVAAIAAGIIVWSLSTNIGKTVAATQPAPPVTGKTVIVASRDIEANSLVTSTMIITATYPENLIPSDAFTDTVELLGNTAKIKVFGGQMLLKRQFVAGAGRVGSSVNVPKGKVLVAFPSTDILNSTGAVQPGDHVDILLSIPISGTARLDAGAGSGSQLGGGAQTLVAQATLQNIEVYSTGQWSPPGSTSSQAQNASLKIITFIVDHQEALILKYVKDSGGTIDLAVRSLEDGAEVQTDPVNIDYLVDLYRFIGLPAKK